MFVLDTNVISALSPSRREQNTGLARWLDLASERVYLSVVTASEIRSGVTKARRLQAFTKAAALEAWWDDVESLYADRMLPFDLAAAAAAAEMIDASRAFAIGFEDIAIAATAVVRGFVVLTENERHFAPLGVQRQNPFRSLPELPA